jgi:hypothetical protein
MRQFYVAHQETALMEQDNIFESTVQLPILMFIRPSTWMPAFFEPVLPRVAWERANMLQNQLLVEAGQFQQVKHTIVCWTRAVCVKRGGDGKYAR